MSIVFVEPYAGTISGHWAANLVSMAMGAKEIGVECHAVVLGGTTPEVAQALEDAGTTLVTAPPRRDPIARIFSAFDVALRRSVSFLRRRFRERRMFEQLSIIRRCFGEAAHLRTARRAGGASATIVLLSGGETLIGTSTALAGAAHQRVVHESEASEWRALPSIERVFARQRRKVQAVCPTVDVARALHDRYTDLAADVQPFATVDPAVRLTVEERIAARVAALGLPVHAVVLALIGGWWPWKDMDTVLRALPLTTRPVAVVAGGSPIDDDGAQGLRRAVRGQLVLEARPLQPEEVRKLYASSDVIVVSRHREVAKESGLVADALRYGVGLVVSDHDPTLNALLANEPWARTFPTGDAHALASLLDELATSPLPPPAPDATARLGFLSPAEAVRRYVARGAPSALHP